MEFRVLGPLEVRGDDGVIALPRRRERVVLAALLVHHGETVSTHRLVGMVWGDDPPRTARGSLQNAVSELRKALGPDHVVTRAPGYALAADRGDVDAVRFERLVRQAAGLDPLARAETLSSALALWRGPAFADLADEPSLHAEAARLDELRLVATEERVDAELELGRGADLAPEIESLVAGNPLRERLRGQLMLALYRSGRQAEALEAYQGARRALVDELGIDPSPVLQDLERRILRQDPSLLASGAPTATMPPPEGSAPTRKTVTVLAAALDDVSELDPERLRARVDRFLATARAVSSGHGGTLDRFLGSEAFAVFGVPQAHEDDSLRAARAAVEMREALAAHDDAVRIGVATGEALVDDANEIPVVGDVLVVATHLRDAAPRGGVLLAERAYDVVRDAVVADRTVTAGPRGLRARVLEAARGARGRARRIDTPFVGRRHELEVLRDALGRATEQRRCVALTVTGDAGIGKTRLAEALAGALVRGRVLRGQCLSYGAGTTFAPLLEIFDKGAGSAAPLPQEGNAGKAARLAAELADPETAVPPRDAYWAVRTMLEWLAGDDPLVVVLDDMHWAEPTLLDLAEYLAQRVAAPVLLLLLARPELLDIRPTLAAVGAEIEALQLGPLPDDEARELVDALGDVLDERSRQRVLERGDGNPLHLEQLSAFLAEEGADAAVDAIPPSLEAVLAGRIDRLPPDARATLQRAAVTQRGIWRGLVIALSEPGSPVDTNLLELTRQGFLVPVRSEGPEDLYGFKHSLVRDVAYGQLPKVLRASLHERAASWWIDAEGGTPDDLLGWHLEQAYRLRAELRADDPELERLAREAGERLLASGLRSTQAGDPTAHDLLTRAASILPDGRSRAIALLELGPWRRTVGDAGGAVEAFDQAHRVAAVVRDDALVARARIDLAWGEAAVRTDDSMRSLEQLIGDLLPTLEAATDHRGQMRAWQFLASIRNYEEQMEASARAAATAAEHARAAGWIPQLAASTEASAILFGPRPVPQALEDVGALLEQFSDHRHGWANIATSAAVLHAMSGGLDTAERLLCDARVLLEEHGDRLMIAVGWSPLRLAVTRLSGDLGAARAHLDAWRSELDDADNETFLATALARLAEHTVEDDPASASELIGRARELASPDDVLVQWLLRVVSARIDALEDRATDARRGVEAARELLRESDALSDRAQLEVHRARVLELTGDHAAAESALGEARWLLTAKANTRALALLDADGTRALV